MKNKIKIPKYKPSPSLLFRKKWLKKGYELINITSLCELKMGTSGWCNDFNEPDETIHHIQVWYRDEIIINFTGNPVVIDDDKYILYFEEDRERDFIIYKKCPIIRGD
jgi:hypothetical protein